MLHHAGVLGPPHNPMLARIKSQDWPSLPADLAHDLDVALLTPGFTTAWWARALGKSHPTVVRRLAGISEALRPEAIENWNSITREDCIRLSQIDGHMPIPVLIQMAADKRDGMTKAEVMKLYGCSHHCVDQAVAKPLLSSPRLPDWFRSLIPGA